MKLKTYEVLSPVQDGVEIQMPGGTIDLTDEAAAELIACGAVRLRSVTKPSAPSAEPVADKPAKKGAK